MVALVAPPYVLADMLCCLGLGFLLAAVYDLARFFLGASRPVCFVLDLLAFLLAAVLLCSFAASRSYSGVVRWYMAAALLAGLAGYFWVLGPATRAVQTAIKWVLGRPFVLLWLLVLRPVFRLVAKAVGQTRQKMRNKAEIRHKKQLKSKAKMLYNSNN